MIVISCSNQLLLNAWELLRCVERGDAVGRHTNR
jgi:hypothetical protein